MPSFSSVLKSKALISSTPRARAAKLTLSFIVDQRPETVCDCAAMPPANTPVPVAVAVIAELRSLNPILPRLTMSSNSSRDLPI